GVDEITCGSDPNVKCDPQDGVCKCGGPGGTICAADEICVLSAGQPASCETNICAGVLCERGMNCDPTDGSCSCGGEICGDGTVCRDNSCVTGSLCDGVTCGA